METVKYIVGAVGFLVIGLAWPGVAVAELQAVGAEYGHGDSVDVLGVGVDWTDLREWPLSPRWGLGIFLRGGVHYWKGQDDNSYLLDFGLSPVLRLQRTASGSELVPYLEAGLGVHLLTQTRINGHRELDTAFQFGEVLGVGIRFGPRHEYDLGLRLQHVSNGSISEHNDGLTFVSVGFAYHFN
jgi:hypothetical protein